MYHPRPGWARVIASGADVGARVYAAGVLGVVPVCPRNFVGVLVLEGMPRMGKWKRWRDEVSVCGGDA